MIQMEREDLKEEDCLGTQSESLSSRCLVTMVQVQFHPGRDFPAQEICSEEGRDVMALAFLNW